MAATNDYWLSTNYATERICVDDNFIITAAAPAYRWAIGKNLQETLTILRKKKQLLSITAIDPGKRK